MATGSPWIEPAQEGAVLAACDVAPVPAGCGET